jgi:predicted phosphate transport protein (TIGR00153 family)
MFRKKPDKFLLYLVDFAKHLEMTADYFVNYKVKDSASLKEFTEKIKGFESEADEKVHTIIKDLNDAFITPIEREDILELTLNLDDVIDGMEELTSLMDIYQILSSDGYIDQFTGHINACAKEVLTSIELIADSKMKDMGPHVIKIKDLESKCDDVYHDSLKELFQNETDPIAVIKYKEIYETLEKIADYYQDVASTLQSIMMKNA